MTKKNSKNLIRITLLLFVFIVLFDILLHNILLTPYYVETQAHWRHLEDFKSLAPVFFFGKLVIATAFSALYILVRKSGSIAEGILLGLLVGALFAGRYMISFATENLFTIEILVSWIVAYALLEHAIAGAIATKAYKAPEQ